MRRTSWGVGHLVVPAVGDVDNYMRLSLMRLKPFDCTAYDEGPAKWGRGLCGARTGGARRRPGKESPPPPSLSMLSSSSLPEVAEVNSNTSTGALASVGRCTWRGTKTGRLCAPATAAAAIANTGGGTAVACTGVSISSGVGDRSRRYANVGAGVGGRSTEDNAASASTKTSKTWSLSGARLWKGNLTAADCV